MALMTGLAITAFLAKQEATRQSSIAREERDRAEENFRAARDAVDRFYTKVSEEDLLKAEGLQPLRRDLLEQALGYYQTFLEQRKEDPAFAIDTAVVQSNVADILSEVADPSEALVAAVTATDMLQRVSGKMSSTSDYKVRMANALGLEAYVLDRLGRTEEAIQKQIQVIQIHESFPNGHEETSPEVLCHLWATRGAFEAQVNRLDDAIKSYEKGLKEGEKKQASLLAPLGMAVEQNNRGLLISGVMPDSPAEQAKLQVGDILLSLADDKLKAVEDLAQAKNKLKGNVSIPVSVMRSGETLELQMTPVYVGDFVLANTKYNLGYLLLIRLGEPEKAKPWLEQAVDEYRRCMFLGGDSMSTIRRGLTTAASSLGICGLRLGNENLYEQGARLAAKTADDNARANPAVPEIRSFAGAELTNLSSFFLKQDRYEEARVACESAISHFRIALETGGNLDSDRLKLMQSLTNLALIRGSQDGAQAAIPIYESVLDIASNFKESDVPELLIAMARLRRNYASSLRTGERMEEAAEQYRLASAIYLRLFEVLKSTGNNKVVQLYQEESIHMLPWRIALYLRLEKQESEALISNEFEEACRSLESTENGKAVVVRLRTGAVGTWCTFADSYDRGSVNELECLERAKTQLRLAEQLAGEDADLQSHISSARGWLADSTADKK
jgi:tetratricopeptide (TPR) repeat protein